MGGTIAVTLREPNGKEHRMCRWTNSLPYWVNNMRLVEKDPKFIKEFIGLWYDMRKDYLENKDNTELKFLSEPMEIGKRKIGGREPQKFRHVMTDVYAPHPLLAPEGYGLVVIDMKENFILHSQGYCSFGDILTSELWMDLRRTMNEENSVMRLKPFVDKRRVIGTFPKEKGKGCDLNNWKEITDFLKDDNRDVHMLLLDMSPFKVIRYDEDLKGFRAMKKKILELGFRLSKQEKQLWEEHLKGLEGYYHVEIEG